ncbi:TPA: SMI1/KNR4 family protein, partial [Vibrio parahaemolyticus]
SFGVKMAFNLTEEQLVNTEGELGARLPHDYRESMKTDNGGEATTEEDDWELYPIKDNSDRKRLARTCNHIIAETKACFGFGNFPHHALAIASNGLGDQMVFLKESEQFKPEVYVWLHETGEIKLLASSFAKLEKL